MSKLFAMAVPILPERAAEWEKFSTELKTTWHAQFCESRNNLGVHERTFLQHSPMGDFVVVTLEGDEPEKAFANFAAGNDEFTNWFAEQVKTVHGVDLRQPPPGPLPELILDSKA